MVSKASEDLPEPDRPVNTTRLSRGMATSMFLRLCSRAPRMVIWRASRADLLLRSAIGLGVRDWVFRAVGQNSTAGPAKCRTVRGSPDGRSKNVEPLLARAPLQARNRG